MTKSSKSSESAKSQAGGPSTQAEEALRQSEQRHQAILQAAMDGYWLSDTQGRLLEVNVAYCRMSGYSEQELLAMRIADLEAAETSEDIARHTQEIVAQGEVRFESRHRRKDGTIFDVEVSAQYRPAEGGRVVSFLRDITGRKQAEAKLNESEQRLREVIDNSQAGYFFIDRAGLFQRANGAWLRMHGYESADEVIGRHFSLTQVEADQEAAQRTVEKLLRGGSIPSGEFSRRCRDGSIGYHSFSIHPVVQAGEVVGLEGFLIDITERKRAEETLKKSEEKFAKAFKASPISIAITGMQDGRYLDVNDLFLKQTGYQREEVVGQASSELGVWVNSDDRQRFIEELTRNGFLRDFAIQYRMRSGELRDFLVSSEIIELDGKPCSLNFIYDITERKRAEEALRESEERFRNVFEEGGLGMAMGSISGGLFIRANKAFCAMLGYTEEELKQLTPKDVTHPDHRGQDVAAVTNLGEGKIQKHLTEKRYLKKNGEVVWGARTLTTIHGADGKALHTLAMIEDITERKRAEENLRASEEKYRSLIQKIQAAVIVHGPDTRILTCNPMAMDLLGLTEEQMLGKAAMDAVFHIFHEDGTLLRVEEYPVNIVIAKRQALRNLIVRVHHPSKELKKDAWFLVNADPVFANEAELVQVIVTFIDITKRKQFEEALRESEERFRKIFEEAHQGIVITSPTFAFEKVNPAFCRMLGYSAAELRSMTFADITHPDHIQQDTENVKKVGRGEMRFYQTEKRYIHKSGKVIWANLIVSSIRDEHSGALRYYLSMINDITARKQAEQEKADLEAQLQQAQKLESVGRLAGGVAHDFNNMLGVILGYAELALTKISPSESLYADMEEIITAAQRSAKVTRQLLAFARKQIVAPKVLDLNETVAGMHKMLARLIGEDIELNWRPAAALWPIKMDPSQIDQILANLCVNARDAIRGVGWITIATGNTILDAEYCAAHSGSVPGEYVRLTVSDNGCGMNQATLDHIFEPFFTTKGVGEGTGLGLAMIYGAVQQNNGFIIAESELGKGATFTIYLPRHAGASSQEWREGAPEAVMGGLETILLVEDEQAVLMLTTKMLEKQGYTVLAASTPSEALRLVKEHSAKIHLLMTDVIMPVMNGRELWQKLSALRPDMRCLFMSGYPSNVIVHHGVLQGGTYFIQKPFIRKDLAAKVREAIEGR